MKRSASAFVVLAVAMLGCSGAPKQNEAPVSISGRLSKGGQPLGNLVVSFHPLERGHARSLAVNPDGTFVGDLISGSYSFYVGQSTAPNSAAILKKIDPKYYEPNMDRRVAVEPGKEILLALD
jgi:hypothetical protein